MRLNLPFFKKSQPKEYFLALLLRDEAIHAIVFEENNGIIHILGEGESILPAPIDDVSFEELLTSSDKAISTAEGNLPGNAQSHKTIFGVKEDWTTDLQIDKDHLVTLKKMCDELDLQPIGFLVFAEAIAHLLQKEEGAPVSGVLVELGTKHITATLLRAGRVLASRQTPTQENLPKTVDSLLMQFSDVEILPSRIILLDTQKRPHLPQQFTNHSWSKQLPFLHVPQITPLQEGFITQAILFGTATQMGFDMLGIPELKVPKGTKESEEPNGVEQTEREGVTGAGDPQNFSGLNEVKEASLGGGDRQDSELEEEIGMESSEQPEPPQQPEERQSSGESFGFVKDKDVLESAPKKPIEFDNLKTPADETPDEFASETFADIPEEVKEESLQSRLPGLGVSGVKITEGMQKVVSWLKKIPFSFPSRGTSAAPTKLLFIAPLLLLIIIGSILWYIFGIKATATLYINPKNVSATQGITFSSTDGTNSSSDTIGGTIIPVTENGNTSTTATGSQDVGDKAKGTVTVYNSDTDSHTIPSGTTITSSNGLQFTTDTNITIASASGDIFSGTKPGTQTVNVTASDIGTQYNLPSGTKFAIGSSSVIAAKNDTAFSGGTKKTVTVVSQEDLDKLISDLEKNLGDKAKQDTQQHVGADKAVLSTFLSADMSNQKFDHKVGDQTGSISLSATITYSALSYSKADLNAVALTIIKSNNQGENISQDAVNESIDNPTVSKDTKSINATLNIKADLLPSVDTQKVAADLAGKPFTKALDSLSYVPQLNSVRGILSPNLFFLPRSFPRISSHINVVVKANE